MAWSPDYVTLDEGKAYLKIPADDLADDNEIAMHITAASRNIDRFTHRQFGKVDAPAARYYRATFDRQRRAWIIETDDLQSSAGVVVEVVDSDTGAVIGEVEQVVFEPVNAPADGMPWTRLRVPSAAAGQLHSGEDGVRVTAPWGWTAFPSSITEACLLQMSRYHSRRNAPFGIAGSPETGSEMRLLNRLDPDVEVALRPFQRYWAAV